MKAEAQTEEDCQQTISFLKGHSYLQLYYKKKSNQKLTANTASTLRRTILSLVRGDIKELLFIKLVFVPLFWKKISTKQNTASTKNCQEFLAWQFPVLKTNKATNSSTSNHPVFSCNENPWLVFGNLFTLLRLTIIFARAVCCWG